MAAHLNELQADSPSLLSKTDSEEPSRVPTDTYAECDALVPMQLLSDISNKQDCLLKSFQTQTAAVTEQSNILAANRLRDEKMSSMDSLTASIQQLQQEALRTSDRHETLQQQVGRVLEAVAAQEESKQATTEKKLAQSEEREQELQNLLLEAEQSLQQQVKIVGDLIAERAAQTSQQEVYGLQDTCRCRCM